MTRRAWIALAAAELVALCCCAGLALFLALEYFAESPTPSPVAQATFTRRWTATLPPSPTAERTNTLVIQPRVTAQSPTSVRAIVTPPSTLYVVAIPTPTAPRIVHPIDFSSTYALSTYPVYGTTLRDLSRSLDANAMPDPHETGSRYYARTDWHLSARWSWKENVGRCEVDRGDVKIAITMTLPVLAQTTGISSDVLTRWNTFVKNTRIHEEGHVKLTRQGARDYQHELGNMSPTPNCGVMSTRMRELFDKHFAAIDRSNIEYDRETRHGFTQGAVFP